MRSYENLYEIYRLIPYKPKIIIDIIKVLSNSYLKSGTKTMVKLTYRGHTYESPSASVQTERKPIILNYRGVKFEYQPQSSPLSCESQDDKKMMKLMYRGQTFDLLQSDIKVKYRGSEYPISLPSICQININRGLKYRGAMY
jgi:hypothetical protein